MGPRSKRLIEAVTPQAGASTRLRMTRGKPIPLVQRPGKEWRPPGSSLVACHLMRLGTRGYFRTYLCRMSTIRLAHGLSNRRDQALPRLQTI